MIRPKNTKAIRKASKREDSSQTGYSIKASIRIEKDGELYIGGGRAMLLELLDKLGSISAAARAMRLGYRNAWLWIDSMNKMAPSPLVEKVRGGAGGGYTRLTEDGHKAISTYKNIRNKYEKLLESELKIDKTTGKQI